MTAGQGALHANFKLSAGGEMVGLFTADGTEVDSLTFAAQTTDVSFGRSPDGSETLVTFNTPTPGSSNQESVFSDGFESGDMSRWSSSGP